MAILIALLILLSVTLSLAIAGSSHMVTELWSFSSNGSQPWGNMYAGEDGTLYTSSGDAIYAIGTNGTLKWSLPVNGQYIQSGTTDDRNVVYLDVPTEVMAVSPDGRRLWSTPCPMQDSTGMSVVGDCLYKYGARDLEVFDCTNGSLLQKVSSPFWPAVDARGNLYTVENHEYAGLQSGRLGALVAFGPGGSLLWWHNLSEYGIDYREIGYGKLWALKDTLLATDGYHLAALSYDGRLLWRTNISQGAILADVDSESYMYLLWHDSTNGHTCFDIISPNGSEKMRIDPECEKSMGQYCDVSDGIAYYAKAAPVTANLTPGDPDTYTVSAYDLREKKTQWNREIEFTPETTTLNTSDIDEVMFDTDVYQVYLSNNMTPVKRFEWMGQETPGIKNRSAIRTMSEGDVVYVNYWAYSYAYPFLFDNSTCVYAGGIAALDSNGKLLWSRQTDSYVTSMTAKNGTIYYRTNDGRFSSTGMDLAAGFALAAGYLFFRFFVLGAVSRARARVDRNENRALVLEYIAGSPGATLYETARGLGMNVGTVRYHLFILSVNHKVKVSKDRSKHVRYFVNRGGYTDDDMLVMSLMKREQIGKLLNILMSSPGVSNADISLALGLPDSAVSRYMRELADRGVVEKRRSANGRLSYVLEDRFRDAIAGIKSNDRPEDSDSIKISGRPAIFATTADE